MEEKDSKTEVAGQPADIQGQPENNPMNTEAMMQMMKHLWPDTNEQREKEYWRNLHKELLFHYECEIGKETNFDDAFAKAVVFARVAMNEIQAYERGDYMEMLENMKPQLDCGEPQSDENNKPNTNNYLDKQ